MPHRATLFPLIASLALVACADADPEPALITQAATSTPAARFGYVAAEFMSIDEVDAALSLLATNHVGLVWGWPADATASELEARFDVVRHAAELGVAVRPWLLLPEEQGYWAGSTNAAEFDAAARKLLDAWGEAGLPPTMLAVDMEAPLERGQEFIELVGKRDLNALVAFLRAGIDRPQYRAATDIYRKLVEHAHRLGWTVEITTLSVVLDDFSDGDDSLRQGLNIPFDGIPWDQITFQVYRTLIGHGLGLKPSPAYTYDYARRTKQRFGNRAAIVLGITNTDELTGDDLPVYDSPREAADDVEAARRAGIVGDAIGLYQLKGILERGPAQAWFQRTSPWLLYPADPATLLARGANFALDAAL